MLLANGLSIFSINGKPVFSNGPKSLPKYPPDCLNLCIWVFDDFILAEEPFGKALRSFQTCVLVNNNLCGKLVSLLVLPATFDEIFKATLVPFFVPDFDFISCELGRFTFKCYIGSFHIKANNKLGHF